MKLLAVLVCPAVGLHLAARSEPEEAAVKRTMAELDFAVLASAELRTRDDVPFFDAFVVVGAAARVCAGERCFDDPDNVVAFARRCESLPWAHCSALDATFGANVTTTYDSPLPATLLSFRHGPPARSSVAAAAQSRAATKKKRDDDVVVESPPEDRNGRLVFSHELQFATL